MSLLILLIISENKENMLSKFNYFRPLIMGSENHTVFIKNSIRFSYFGDE